MDKKDVLIISHNYFKIVDELCYDINVSTLKGKEKAKAIIDTGANYSIISKKFIHELQPKNSYSPKMINGKLSDGFHFDIHFSETFVLENFILYPMPPYLDDDLLIGMNIITMGELIVSNHKDQTSFIFRIPSEQKINF